jgi:6-phosphogluconolactonase
VLPDPQAVARAGAEMFVEHAARAIAERGVFTVVVSGGSTPRAMFDLLSSDEFEGRVDWTNVELFFADERCVPADHPESNYRMVHERLISKVPLPLDNVYRMRGEIEPNEAAKLYGLQLRDIFGDGGPDLVFLGMGEDGHTASLFPHTAALKEREHRCVANHVPYDYIPVGTNWRITLTAPFLNRSATVVIMVTGKSKAKTLAEVLEGDHDPQRLPVQLISPDPGELTWLLDADVADM